MNTSPDFPAAKLVPAPSLRSARNSLPSKTAVQPASGAKLRVLQTGSLVFRLGADDTVYGSSANVHWRNNLILGENSSPAIFSVNTNTNYNSSDYNGVVDLAAEGVAVETVLAPAVQVESG